MEAKFAAFDFSAETVRAIVALAVLKTFDPGDHVVVNGEQGDQAYLILNGTVRISNCTPQGREVWQYERRAGSIVGEFSMINPGPRMADVIAETTAEVAVLSGRVLSRLIDENRDFARWLISDMAARIADMNQSVYRLVSQNLSIRTCVELAKLCPDSPDRNGEYVISPRPVVTRMAERLNTNRENLSRELSSLARQGIIKVRKGDLVVLDRDFLVSALRY